MYILVSFSIKRNYGVEIIVFWHFMQRKSACFFYDFQYDHARIKSLSDRLVNKIQAALPMVIRNGDPERSYPGLTSHI